MLNHLLNIALEHDFMPDRDFKKNCSLCLWRIDDILHHCYSLFSFLGYASSSSGASSGGLYGDNAYQSTYSSNYPYTNSYAGYAGAVPVGPFVNPYSFQSSFAEYYNAISDFNRKYG